MGFILGSSIVAPKNGYTIPRLELCGAVLAVEIGESIATHLDFHIEDFTFILTAKWFWITSSKKTLEDFTHM